jgi:hypothetical protein
MKREMQNRGKYEKERKKEERSMEVESKRVNCWQNMAKINQTEM